MSRTLKVTGNHVMCMISKGNLVNFARLVLPAVSEEEETWLTSFCVQCIIKRLLYSVFVISRIIKDLNRVISRSRRLGLITITSTLIILDITKTSSLFIIRSHNRVRRPQPRAISTFGAVPMIWNKLRHRLRNKRELFARIFAGCRAGEMASEIPELAYAFGQQLNAFMAVEILLKYFRRRLPQFEWNTGRRLTAFP